LIRALSSGATIGDATSRIRSIAVSGEDPNGLDSVLALGGTALFTHVPWFRPFPR
jgi:hypothetical protein